MGQDKGRKGTGSQERKKEEKSLTEQCGTLVSVLQNATVSLLLLSKLFTVQIL